MYKVFTESPDGQPQFLFHGVGGSRRVPLDRWLAAEVKWAREGSNPHYWTAFHCYRSLDAVGRWLRRCRIRTGRVVVRVEVAATRPKPTGGHAVLAEQMCLAASAWAERRPLLDFEGQTEPG